MYLGVLMITTILGIITLFCGQMIKNHFNKIENSIDIYNDDTVYKSGKQVEFIDGLVSKYNGILEYRSNDIDAYTFVRHFFYQQKIGKFDYTVIERVATGGKWGMWLVLVGAILLGNYRISDLYNLPTTIYVGASILICLIVSCVEFIQGIEMKRNIVIIKVQDYLVNIEPIERKRSKELKTIKNLESRIDKLEYELGKYVNLEEQEIVFEESDFNSTGKLKEEDVIKVLDNINLEV